jgi:hypothetical protein
MRRKPPFPPATIIPHPASTPTQPPYELGEPGRDLWGRIQHEYRIEDAAGIELLAQACRAADRVYDLASIIAKDGATIDTKYGLREHPLLKSELAARSFIVRTLEKLGLNLEPVRPIGRPAYGRGRHVD